MPYNKRELADVIDEENRQLWIKRTVQDLYEKGHSINDRTHLLNFGIIDPEGCFDNYIPQDMLRFFGNIYQMDKDEYQFDRDSPEEDDDEDDENPLLIEDENFVWWD